jgi:imidazole glycerol phosphate synthase glutamine amidotransferase subunit
VKLVVVPTGTANIASVLAAFRRLQVPAKMARGVDDLETADRLVLPGVGSFGAALEEIDRTGLREALSSRLKEGRPTLAVCVGMQMLATASEETDGAVGLGVLAEDVRRFPDAVRVPQLGWNRVEPDGQCRFVDAGWAYFANSYRLDSVPAGWSAALTDHGGTFVSALERGEVLACQFHPELSGPWGAAVLERWLGRAA